MKKLTVIFLIFLSTMLLLYAQEDDIEEDADDVSIVESKSQKKSGAFSFARRYFEVGVNAGAGLGNNVIGSSDIFTKNIILDLNKFNSKDGFIINTDLLGDFFLNVRMDHGWGFGFFAGFSGDISANFSESLLNLISVGNANNPVASGTIGASGSVFADAGVNAFAKFGGLRVGISAAVYVPLVYIPTNSRMAYFLDTNVGLKVWTEGAIEMYTPFSLQEDSSFGASDITNAYGLDFSLEAEYPLFPFLNVGGSIAHIPLSAAELQNRTLLRLKSVHEDGYIIYTDDLMTDGLSISDIEFERTYDNESVTIRRPIRFDVYGILRPFARNRDLFALRGNAGVTADITDEETYFNFGLEARTSLVRNLFSAYVSTGLVEDIWRHRLGIAVNFRFFELGLEGSLRSDDFASSFDGQGFGFKAGLRFGW